MENSSINFFKPAPKKACIISPQTKIVNLKRVNISHRNLNAKISVPYNPIKYHFHETNTIHTPTGIFIWHIKLIKGTIGQSITAKSDFLISHLKCPCFQTPKVHSNFKETFSDTVDSLLIQTQALPNTCEHCSTESNIQKESQPNCENSLKSKNINLPTDSSPTHPTPIQFFKSSVKNHKSLIQKYLVNRNKPQTHLEIEQTLYEIIEDLQTVEPSQRFIFSYMKNLIQCLCADFDNKKSTSQNNTDVSSKNAILKSLIFVEDNEDIDSYPKSASSAQFYSNNMHSFSYETKRENEFKRRFVNMARNGAKLKSTFSITEKIQPLKSPDGHLIRNGFHKQTGSINFPIKKAQSYTQLTIPRLNIEKIFQKKNENINTKGYLEEFMDKYDEFSNSWRESMEQMKTVAAMRQENNKFLNSANEDQSTSHKN